MNTKSKKNNLKIEESSQQWHSPKLDEKDNEVTSDILDSCKCSIFIENPEDSANPFYDETKEERKKDSSLKSQSNDSQWHSIERDEKKENTPNINENS